MAVSYKDINTLSQKATIAGTEKIPVSDTEYITPSQIADAALPSVTQQDNGKALSVVSGNWSPKTLDFLPSSGGTITGELVINPGNTVYGGVIRDVATQSGGWSRRLAWFRYNTDYIFGLSAYGNASGLQYGYIGCNPTYNGLNLRFTTDSLRWGDDVLFHAGNSNKSTIDWAAKDLTCSGTARASGYVVPNETGFLKANGTVDNNQYMLSSKITVSSSEPTAEDGNDGDIWIVI